MLNGFEKKKYITARNAYNKKGDGKYKGTQVIFAVYSNNLSPKLVIPRILGLTNPFNRNIISLATRDGAVWKLVGLITQRSQVQILLPQLNEEARGLVVPGLFCYIYRKCRKGEYLWQRKKRRKKAEVFSG